MRAHLAELGRAGEARSSVARKVSALRTFVRYLRREGLHRARSDLADRGAAARADAAGPPDRTARWSGCSTARRAHEPLGRRDRAILELFYASGLRLSELESLDLENVDLSGRMVRVMGKGRKERIVPFNQAAERALRAWLKDRAVILRRENEERRTKNEERANERNEERNERRDAASARTRTAATRCSSTIAARG